MIAGLMRMSSARRTGPAPCSLTRSKMRAFFSLLSNSALMIATMTIPLLTGTTTAAMRSLWDERAENLLRFNCVLPIKPTGRLAPSEAKSLIRIEAVVRGAKHKSSCKLPQMITSSATCGSKWLIQKRKVPVNAAEFRNR